MAATQLCLSFCSDAACMKVLCNGLMAFTLVLAVFSMGQPQQLATADEAPAAPWSFTVIKNMEQGVIALRLACFAAALDGKIVTTVLEQQLGKEAEGYASRSKLRLVRHAQVSVGVAFFSMLAGMVLSALAVQGFTSFLPYKVFVMSAGIVLMLLFTARLFRSEHARQA